MADETFEHRVQRLFGSTLFSAVPKSAFPTASWSVADGAVERREWNRSTGDEDDREDIPCSSAFYDDGGCLQKRSERRKDLKKKQFEGNLGDLDDLEDVEEEVEEKGAGGDEEWDIRASVGLDPTLDNEDEEDEFDRAALCREDDGEHVYMRDVKDHGPYLSCRNVIPDLYEDILEEGHLHLKDPRADHLAASARLTEDEKATGSLPDKDLSVELRAKITEVDVNLKPILKRKEVQINPKPNKRVRFDPACGDVGYVTSEEPRDFHTVPQSMEATVAEDVDPSPLGSIGVPDYMRNPSKYTRYEFDSIGDDEKSNKCAFEDFRNLVKIAKPELQSDFPMELPKTVTFTPRKKACDAMTIDAKTGFDSKESVQVMNSTIITAEEDNESEACLMDEDAPMEEASSSTKKERRYRSKSNVDDSS